MSSPTTISAGVHGSRPNELVRTIGPRHRRSRRKLIIVGILLIIAVVALWPARYGGITGLTVVHGHSMEPTFHTGDLLLSIKQPSYRVGDVISYTVPAGQDGAGGRVIHRIFAIVGSGQGMRYRTKGDNNPDIDPWSSTPSDVLGREILSAPGVGTFLSPANSPTALGLVFGALVTGALWRNSSDAAKRHGRRARTAKTNEVQ